MIFFINLCIKLSGEYLLVIVVGFEFHTSFCADMITILLRYVGRIERKFHLFQEILNRANIV